MIHSDKQPYFIFASSGVIFSNIILGFYNQSPQSNSEYASATETKKLWYSLLKMVAVIFSVLSLIFIDYGAVHYAILALQLYVKSYNWRTFNDIFPEDQQPNVKIDTRKEVA